jgi:putative holliday junction resolvase
LINAIINGTKLLNLAEALYFCRMGRLMAIDYGKKRCGLAVTDPSQTIATALDTVPSHLIMDYLRKYFSKEAVDQLVVGEPKRLNNSDSETTLLVHQFVRDLTRQFPEMTIVMYDERFTSKIATRSLLESGQNKKTRQDKSVLDRVSATILLQDYLNSLQFKK